MATSTVLDLYKAGKELGYEGTALQQFVKDVQGEERNLRCEEREERSKAMDIEFERQKELQQEKLAQEEKLQQEKLAQEEKLQREKLAHEGEMAKLNATAKKEELEELINANKMKQHELELKEKEMKDKASSTVKAGQAKMPKLPTWQEKDDMDSYLTRYEKYAQVQAWPGDRWAINLSALLTGKALDVYYRMPEEEIDTYESVKTALLKNFQFTEDGFRQKLFTSKAQIGETAAQYYARLDGYMKRWITLSKIQKTFEDLSGLVMKMAFFDGCHITLATHLKEHGSKTNLELVQLADIYIQAHNLNSLSQANISGAKRSTSTPTINNSNVKQNIVCNFCKKAGHKSPDCKLKRNSASLSCHLCGEKGHIRPNCPKNEKNQSPVKDDRNDGPTCYLCHRKGHMARNCPGVQKAAALVEVDTDEASDSIEKHHCHGCDHKAHAAYFVTDIDISDAEGVKDEVMRDGRNYKICKPGCRTLVGVYNCHKLPTCSCQLEGKDVTMLRDSGCTGVVVHQKFVKPEQYTGQHKLILMIDGSVKKVPVARVNINSPYYQGKVDAMVLSTPVYDVILGNIVGARSVGDPNPNWKKEDILRNGDEEEDVEVSIEDPKEEIGCAVKTRAQIQQEKKKITELIVQELDPVTSKQKTFSMEQIQDDTLKRIWNGLQEEKLWVKTTQNGESWYECKDGILYRIYKNKRRDRVLHQVVLPKLRRQQCIKLAHSSLLGGHMGVMKTLNRITNKFYWPGIQGDVTRFCKSCDICQKTLPKGKVNRVPLDEMPKIDVPFKRVAVDLVGPIYPASSSGKRYIFTMVDYATRYPEAIALSGIDTIQVAEAMMEIYCRLGFPTEVLSDLGTQFTSNLMKEVSRLIAVRRLTTTPYHPMCNGLCEKINGVLKTILRRLCSERPQDWDRYLPAVLFAYREVPQESTGFSPFELLYGRDVRGPMSILKELWIKEDGINDEEVKTTYQYVLELKDRIEKTCELAREELSKSAKRYKRYYDKKAKSRVLQPEDEALLLLPTDSNKLLLQWKGPYKITERVGKYTYKLNIKGRNRTFHINMLKQYWRPNEDESQEEEEEEEIGAVMVVSEDKDEEVSLPVPGGSKETYEDVKYSEELTEERLSEARSLVETYQQIFTDTPGTTNLEEHHIQLTTDEPVKQRPYPLPFSMREIVKEEIQRMLEDGIIERTDSPYSAPIVMVKKPDGTYRLCIDYRKLNRVTIFDGEPMPAAIDIFSSLVEDKYFSKFDLSKGFWQIPIKEEDKLKTAFVTQDGAYQFKKMPFGAINSTATFNRLMRKCLGQVKDVHSFVDDVLVHSKTWEEHLDTLQQVFEAIKDAGLTIRPKKSQVGCLSLQFLGHNVGKGVLSPQEEKVQNILGARPPTTKKQVRSFLGSIGYYRNFIPNFSLIAAPLTDLTKKYNSNSVKWGKNEDQAFTKLKKLITQEPILQIPDFQKTFYLQTDASDMGVGGVLLQEWNDIKCPIAFFSRKFLERQTRYSIIEKECLAIIWSIQKFEIYLFGRQFVLETDHQALTFIDQVKIKNNRVMRWALILQNYRFQVLAIKGSDNVIADYLSRSLD